MGEHQVQTYAGSYLRFARFDELFFSRINRRVKVADPSLDREADFQDDANFKAGLLKCRRIREKRRCSLGIHDKTTFTDTDRLRTSARHTKVCSPSSCVTYKPQVYISTGVKVVVDSILAGSKLRSLHPL